LPDRSELQATLFGDIEKFHSTFLAVTGRRPPSPPEIIRLTVESACADECLRRDGAVGQALNTRNYVSVGTEFHWVDGESRKISFNAAPGAVVPPTQGAISRCSARPAAPQRSAGVIRADVMTPVVESDRDGERTR